MHSDLNSALENLSADELESLKNEGLHSLNWKKLMGMAGDKNRIRFLKPYFTELLSRNATEINDGFVELVSMAAHIDADDDFSSLRFTRQFFELLWLNERSNPMVEANLEHARAVRML